MSRIKNRLTRLLCLVGAHRWSPEREGFYAVEGYDATSFVCQRCDYIDQRRKRPA